MKKCASVAFVMFYLASQSFCSQSGGAGQTYIDQWGIKRPVVSRACVGGPPDYCAPTDMRIIGQSAINYYTQGQNDIFGGGPAVGVPFIDPDSGNEFVRVTDFNTQQWSGPPFDRLQWNFQTDSAAEMYQWSAYNSNLVADLLYDGTHHLPWNPADGGYTFAIEDTGGNYYHYALDGVTMQTQLLTPPNGFQSPSHDDWVISGGFSLSDPWLQWGANGVNIQYYCLPGVPNSDPICDSKGDTLTTLFTPSSSNCGSTIPSGLTSGYGGFDTQADRSDTTIGEIIESPSGGERDRRYYLVYNRVSGDCFWFDAFTGNYGGQHGSTSYSGTTGPSLALPSPDGTQVLDEPVDGSLTGTFCITTSFIGNSGVGTETAPETAQCIQLSSQSVPVEDPTIAASNPDYNYFIAAIASRSPYGVGVYACRESSPPTPCTNYTEQAQVVWSSMPYTMSSYTTSGNASNSVSQAGMYIHQGRLSQNGNYVLMTTEGSGAYAYGFGDLQIANVSNGYIAHFYFVPDGGHQTIGNNQIVYGWNNNVLTQLASRQPPDVYSNPRVLQVGAGQNGYPAGWAGHIPDDTHPSWSDDNSSDTYPVVQTYTPSGYSSTSAAYGTVFVMDATGTGTTATISGAQTGAVVGQWVNLYPFGQYNGLYQVQSIESPTSFTVASTGTGIYNNGQVDFSYLPPDGTWTRYGHAGFSNPAFNRALPYLGETVGWSTDGSSQVWRFGSNRNPGWWFNYPDVTGACSTSSTGSCYTFTGGSTLGSESPDGKFMIFTSYWEWQGCIAPGWSPGVMDVLGDKICDQNGVVQDVTTAGKRGMSMPIFNDTPNGKTTDGAVTWTALYPCGDQNIIPIYGASSYTGCFTNVFIERLK